MRETLRTAMQLRSARARLAAVLLVAVAVGATLVGVSLLGSTSTKATPTLSAAAEQSLFTGIPQQGDALGSPTAPVTLVEYADLQCPYCARWSQSALPSIVKRYVRPGKLRIVFNGMAFVGPDSVTALRTAIAAGREGRLWNVVHGLFAVQGAENSNWVSDGIVVEIARRAGLDGAKLIEERSAGWVDKELTRAAADAENAGIHSTPSFRLGPTGGRLAPVQLDSLGPDSLDAAIDAELQS